MMKCRPPCQVKRWSVSASCISNGWSGETPMSRGSSSSQPDCVLCGSRLTMVTTTFVPSGDDFA